MQAVTDLPGCSHFGVGRPYFQKEDGIPQNSLAIDSRAGIISPCRRLRRFSPDAHIVNHFARKLQCRCPSNSHLRRRHLLNRSPFQSHLLLRFLVTRSPIICRILSKHRGRSCGDMQYHFLQDMRPHCWPVCRGSSVGRGRLCCGAEPSSTAELVSISATTDC